MHKKRGERITITKDVIINRRMKAECIDLSEKGMYIYTKRAFIPGTIINVGFKLGNELINISASVQHAQSGIGIGVEFVGIKAETKDKIRDYISVIKNYISQKGRKKTES